MNKLSIYLSYLLRHHPEDLNLHMDKYGYVSVEELIVNMNNKGTYHLDLELLKKIVETDKKQRYKFKDEFEYIKANQGHSLSFVEVELHYITPPDYLYHGTHKEAYDKINECGYISKMQRHAVHMNDNVESASQSAKRWKKEPVVLKIDAKKMYNDGYKLGVTDNNVWCVDTVMCEYIVDVIKV